MRYYTLVTLPMFSKQSLVFVEYFMEILAYGFKFALLIHHGGGEDVI